MKGTPTLLGRALWTLYFVEILIASVFLAWFAMKQMNYLFPLGYRWLNIADTVEQYAPQNRNRKGFEQTSEAERMRIFNEIVTAVHDNGKGLTAITYHDQSGKVLDTFLTAAEINHLMDVATLFKLGVYLGWSSLTFPLLLWLIKRRGLPIPRLRQVLLGALGAVAGTTLLILAAGPTRVFYAIHEWIFPPQHQWFFYYQDSLMTTLMQAPNLFGFIGAWLALLSLTILCGLLLFSYALFKK